MKLNYKELLTGLFRDFRNTHNQNVKDIESDMAEVNDKATSAQTDASEALKGSNEAVQKANNAQAQVDALVVGSNTSPAETVQARVDAKNRTFTTIKQRIDNDYIEISAELAKTLKQDELLSMANMGQDVREAMTGGSVPIVGVNSILETNIVDKQVTASKTTFAQKGKNLWDGKYTYDVRLSGAVPYVVGSYPEAISVIFKGEKGKTYTISRPGETDLYHVATFINKPVTGSTANRSLNPGVTFWTSFTVTLEGDEEYIMFSISSQTQKLTPSWLQIEVGSVATAYSDPKNVIVSLETGSVPFNALRKNEIVLSPENTTFVQKGKNLWDGKYVNDIRLSGASPYTIASSTGAISIIFKGEKGKTYTIQRSEDSDYFGIATFVNYPSVGAAGVRGIRGNGPAQSVPPVTVTLEGDEQYIFIGVSSNTAMKAPSWVQIEVGSVATSYSPVGAVKILLEQEEDTSVDKTPKINAVKAGETLSIYVPSKTNPSRFIRHNYLRKIASSSNLDTWLYDSAGIYTKSSGAYTLEFMLFTSSDNEGVLTVSGEGDFIGGKHGYDIMESLDVIIDGKQVDMSKDFNLECSFIKIVNKSRVLHDLATDLPENKAFTRYKIHTWDLNTFTLEGRWVAQHDMDISTGKLCDYSIDKVNNGVSILKWGRYDYDYQKTDVSINYAGTGVDIKRNGVKKQELWGESTSFYLALSCDWDMSKYPSSYGHITELEGTRAKIYFDITGQYSIKSGESITHKNHYDFRF